METIKLSNGEVRYREKVYIKGKAQNGPIFHRRSDAIAWKHQKQSEINKSKILGHEFTIRERLRFIDYGNQFINMKIDGIRSCNTARHYITTLKKHIFPIVKDLFLDEIKQRHADLLVSNLLKSDHNEAGVNKILQVLKTILLSAEKNDLIMKNPLRDYPKLKVVSRIPTYWSVNEINQFLSMNCKNEYISLYITALNSGMRRGELAGLKWDKVLFNLNLIEVARSRDRDGLKETTKTKLTRFVPINSVLRAELTKLFAKRSHYHNFVFTKNDGSPIEVQHVYRYFKQAQRYAELNNMIRFHDLRHCYASHFMMNGGNLYDLQKILGHSKSDMTQIYAHLSQDHLINAANIVSFGINNHVSNFGDNNNNLNIEKTNSTGSSLFQLEDSPFSAQWKESEENLNLLQLAN